VTFMIAAAGTGGHVFPGLSVGEALLDLGVSRESITFVGGSRLEAKVYPEQGFPFLEVELRGLQRSMTPKNLTLPGVIAKARKRIRSALVTAGTKAVLGMGGYVTIPAGSAAKSAGVPFFVSEQNAHAGLANKVASRWADVSFVSFPQTEGLPSGEWVGNPVRAPFWAFERDALKTEAMKKYGLNPALPVLGVFGGSLGAGVINDAIVDLVHDWDGPSLQIIHLTGERNIDALSGLSSGSVTWTRVPFEESMEIFYAACDLVVARAGGAVAELTATATPSILIPGDFGSGGHQSANAKFLTESGASITLGETELRGLAAVVGETLFGPEPLGEMVRSARRIARPKAAHEIAKRMIEAA